MKTCFKCGLAKPLSEFYKHKQMADGHLGKCKTCTKADVHANREKNIDSIREYDRQRGNRMSASDLAAQRKRHPEWAAAHRAVARAKRKGVLVPQPCEVCGATNVHAHHPDYSKHLDVMWLCPLHHREQHAKEEA